MSEEALLLVPQDYRRLPRWAGAAASILERLEFRVAVAPAPRFMRLAWLLAAAPQEIAEEATRWRAEVGNKDVVLLSPAAACTLRERWAPLFPRTWEWHEVVARHLKVESGAGSGRVLVFKGCFAGWTATWEDALGRVLRAGGATEWMTPSYLLCCGGKPGLRRYFPVLADALLAKTVDIVRQYRPDLVLVVEPDCLERVAAGVQQAGLQVPVLHTAEWLLRNGRPL